jgi:N-acetylglutamate synthase-like GNAT family acetyltransferase
MVHILNAAISDLKFMEEILSTRELGPKYSLNYFKRLIKSKEGIFLIAEHASKIVGVAYGEFSEKEDFAELTGIAVLEKYRNKGIGSQLLREFEKIIHNKNISAIELFANINTLAKHIHKLGYKKGGTYISCSKNLKKLEK